MLKMGQSLANTKFGQSIRPNIRLGNMWLLLNFGKNLAPFVAAFCARRWR